MDIKIVVCDIDQTLVSTHKTLTPRARHAILSLKKHGVLFGIASGRPLDELKTIGKWGIEFDLIIGANGCKLVDNLLNKTYSYYPMKKEWIKQAIELMSPFDCNPLVAFDGYTLYKKFDYHCIRSKSITGKEYFIIKDISELYQEDNDKIMFRVHEDDMPKIEEHLQNHPSQEYRGFKSGPSMIEFANIHVSKGYALEQFCKNHNILPNQVWAFGDASNDNEMLVFAGVGVCMKNGCIDTKYIADRITDKTCKDDGWADFVENHILIPQHWI